MLRFDGETAPFRNGAVLLVVMHHFLTQHLQLSVVLVVLDFNS